MKREKVFSKGGFYSFVVHNNIVGHREAIAIICQGIAQWLSLKKQGQVKVLDLACGGEPFVIISVMSQFTGIRFEYTGIDINPDQVALAQRYSGYPANISHVAIIQRNAWQPSDWGLNETYDLIFSGLNFHHATPEELFFLGKALQPFLSPKGIVVNYDVYRPRGIPYLRKPNCNPNNKNDIYALVPPEALSGIDLSGLGIVEYAFGAHPYDWRQDLLRISKTLLDELGADKAGAEEMLDHVARRDLPVSTEEMQRIWSLVGLETHVYDFQKTNHPLKDYLAVIMARKAREI
ncbi:MAG: class I SAM-dependent methyltransferase [Elusimicrobia bacterium]|nr:class I SAM-dependent methyltransferase [Elusimicrobiota bacterium]